MNAASGQWRVTAHDSLSEPPATPSASPTATRATALAIAAVITVLDLISKYWAQNALANSDPIVLLPVLRLIYAENTGISFSLFAGGGDTTRWLLVAVGIAVVAVLFYLLWKSTAMLEAAAYGIIIGGAVGNISDRIRLGYVVDFIDAHWQDHHWPAFNIADSAITIGAILIIYTTLKSSQPS